MLITINTDKQLIRVDTWDAILERAGFTNDLDPKQHELKAIIGRYAFRDKLRCGLSSCHTPHNRGYIVVTKSGLETNIGKDCGKTHFGVDFNDMSRQFERDVTEKENREPSGASISAWTSWRRRSRGSGKVIEERTGCTSAPALWSNSTGGVRRRSFAGWAT
ncbi:hypothetical protein OWT26_25875 [Burkholderia sp. 1A5]